MRTLAAILGFATAFSQRIEAAELSAQEDLRARTLIAELGHDSFEVREAADRALRALGEPALPLLRAAMDSDDAEIRLRAGALAALIRLRADVLAAQNDPARRGLVSVWYYSIENDNRGLFDSQEADDDSDAFRIRRVEIPFTLEIREVKER